MVDNAGCRPSFSYMISRWMSSTPRFIAPPTAPPEHLLRNIAISSRIGHYQTFLFVISLGMSKTNLKDSRFRC